MNIQICPLDCINQTGMEIPQTWTPVNSQVPLVLEASRKEYQTPLALNHSGAKNCTTA